MSYTVYMHILPNNKRYIGITKQTLDGRFKNGLGYGTQLFYRAIKKYGWNNIKHVILASDLTRDEACDLEIKYIAKYKTNNLKYGYNRTSGGDGTCNFSHKNPHNDDWRKKVSLAHMGKKHSDETKQKISNSMKGYKWSDERKQKYSQSQKDRGYKPSKACLEASYKKRVKPIYQYDFNNNLVSVYSSMSDTADKLGISVSYISMVCSGKLKSDKYIFIKGE